LDHWFGNSNAVLRGDNAVPTLDYAAAAQYVLGLLTAMVLKRWQAL
jgi:hypothetical protein